MQEIEQKLKHLPESPGVYVMLDKDGQIIYVGKAKNLKNRVRQYFFNTAKTLKVSTMVSNIGSSHSNWWFIGKGSTPTLIQTSIASNFAWFGFSQQTDKVSLPFQPT